MTDTLDLDKTTARKAAFAARKAAHGTATDAAEKALSVFLGSNVHANARIIAGYRPIRTEIDPTALMIALHHAGHRLAVPVILGEGQPLTFHEWWPGVAMQSGAFGAEVPVDTHVLIPDLLIVPLLSFDRAGYRLGYGGGFYDRTLEKLRARQRTTAVGFAYAAQEMSAVPTEPTDQQLDMIVTEAEVIKSGATG